MEPNELSALGSRGGLPGVGWGGGKEYSLVVRVCWGCNVSPLI